MEKFMLTDNNAFPKIGYGLCLFNIDKHSVAAAHLDSSSVRLILHKTYCIH